VELALQSEIVAIAQEKDRTLSLAQAGQLYKRYLPSCLTPPKFRRKHMQDSFRPVWRKYLGHVWEWHQRRLDVYTQHHATSLMRSALVGMDVDNSTLNRLVDEQTSTHSAIPVSLKVGAVPRFDREATDDVTIRSWMHSAYDHLLEMWIKAGSSGTLRLPDDEVWTPPSVAAQLLVAELDTLVIEPPPTPIARQSSQLMRATAGKPKLKKGPPSGRRLKTKKSASRMEV